MGLKELVGKLTAPWARAVEQLDAQGRPVPVEGKNVLVITKEDHADCGEYPYIPQLQTKPSYDPTYELGI